MKRMRPRPLKRPAWSDRRLFTPPVLQVPRLDRSHLVSRLEALVSQGIGLIYGPAGFGKTVLAALLFERWASAGHECIWVSLAQEHNDIVHLRADLSKASGLAKPGPGRLKATRREANSERQWELAFLDWVAQRAPTPVTFFFDGLDQLDRADSIACLRRLALDLPENGRVIITGRSPRSIDLSRAQASGKVLEMSSHALSFEEGEAEHLLKGLVDGARLSELIAMMEGWPVAVQHGRLFLQQFPGLTSVNRLLEDCSDAMGRYIDAQILAALSEEARNFLACAVELGTHSLELIEAARAYETRSEVLAELEDLDPLIGISPEASVGVRAHRAITARLRSRTLRVETSRSLHARAADWLFAHNEAPSAVKHLIAAGDITGAAQMLERVGLNVLLSHLGPPQLKSLLRIVPASAMAALPRARLVWIIMLLNDGRRDEAAAELQRLKANPPQVRPVDAPLFAEDLKTVEISFRVVSDNFPSAEELGGISAEPPSYETINSLSLLAHQQRGLFRRAKREIEHLFGIVSQTSYKFDAACLRTYRGLIAYAEGALEQAEEDYSEAASLDPGVAMSAPSLMIDVPRAELYYERDAPARAAEILANHDGHWECLEDWFDIYAARIVTSARLMVLNGDTSGAISMLRSEASIARSKGLLVRHATVVAAAVEIAVQTGLGETEVLGLGKDLSPNVVEFGAWEVLPWRLIDLVCTANIRLALIRGDPTAAIAEASRLMEHWNRIGLVRGQIRTQILLAAAHTRLSNDVSNELIKQAAELSFRTRHMRVLLDERMLIATLFARLSKSDTSRSIPGQLLEWINSIRRRIDMEAHTVSAGLASPLSTRERDVLIGLSQGQTNKMIARQCGISANTVKHHLRHLYSKLKVRRRVQAVDEGRRRSLIP